MRRQIVGQEMDKSISGDTEVVARLARIERMLRSVCVAEEFPWFVSDDATLHDVSTLGVEEIRERLCAVYGEIAANVDLQLPIWQLIDQLYNASPLSERVTNESTASPIKLGYRIISGFPKIGELENLDEVTCGRKVDPC